MTDIPVAPLVMLGTLVFTLVNFLKFLRAGDFNAAATQVSAWAIGVVTIFLASASSVLGMGVSVNGVRLNDLDTYSKIIVGMLATSILSTVNEIKKAIDNHDSAQTPKLFRK